MDVPPRGKCYFTDREVHSTTSLSTAEAELLAAKEAMTQAIHLRNILNDLGAPQTEETTIYIDSQAAYQAALGESFSKRLKHINIALQFTRELLKSGQIKLSLIRSEDQGADFLTKPLPLALFAKGCSIAGLQETYDIPKTSKTEDDED